MGGRMVVDEFNSVVTVTAIRVFGRAYTPPHICIYLITRLFSLSLSVSPSHLASYTARRDRVITKRYNKPRRCGFSSIRFVSRGRRDWIVVLTMRRDAIIHTSLVLAANYVSSCPLLLYPLPPDHLPPRNPVLIFLLFTTVLHFNTIAAYLQNEIHAIEKGGEKNSLRNSHQDSIFVVWISFIVDLETCNKIMI